MKSVLKSAMASNDAMYRKWHTMYLQRRGCGVHDVAEGFLIHEALSDTELMAAWLEELHNSTDD